MRPRFISEEELKEMQARVRGGVVGTRKLPLKSIASRADCEAPGKTPRCTAGSNPAPSPFHYTLAITGQLPSGKNRIIIRRDGHRYPEKRFINWRGKAYLQIMEQWWRPFGMPRPIITTPVCLTCDYWPGDQRTRDVSGMLDAIFHLLVYCKVLKDDGLIYDVVWRRHEINENFPKVVMELEAYQ